MDNWEIKIYDIHKICRFCLDESKTMNGLYESNNVHQMSVAELLNNCMSLQVEEDEELPNLVCTKCEAEVFQICQFRLKYDQSRKYLQEYLADLEEESLKKEQIIVVTADGKAVDNSMVEYPLHILKDDIEVDNSVIELVEESASDTEMLKKETFKKVQKKKRRNVEEKSILTCKVCNETFENKIKLTDHRRKSLHYTRKTVTCSQCKLLVPVQNYKSHFLKHSSEFRCDRCGKRFSNNYNLKRHLYIHTNQTPYSCEICDAKFSRQDKLKVHVMIHTSDKPFTCDTCGQQFQQRDKLKYHQERVAPCNGNNSDYSELKYKRTLFCDICSKSFTLASSLRTHKLLHTDERVICSDCGKPYPNEKKLNDHRLQVHFRKNANEKEFLCNICAKQYSNKAILHRHILSHMGLAKSYKCKICNKAFTQSGSLALHMKIHTGEKPFVCHICSRAFNKPSNLQRHLRTHDNIRPYVCAICEKCFTVKQSLVVHTRIHTGEKPFACAVCNKKFIDRGSLNKHIRIHNERS